MPCYDHRDSPSYIQEHEVKPLQERVDQYARWLCLILRRQSPYAISLLPEDLRQWWREHQLAEQRRAAEHRVDGGE